MDRKEFSELLIQARKDAGFSKNKLCRTMPIAFGELQKIEQAHSNYSIHRACLYLHALGKAMYISDNNGNSIKCTEILFVRWLQKQLKIVTIKELSRTSGIAETTISKIQLQKTIASIDTFLKLIESLGYKIETIC